MIKKTKHIVFVEQNNALIFLAINAAKLSLALQRDAQLE